MTQIAQTILEQLGGNRFIAMTGAKKLIAHEDGLSFKIGRNSSGANYVKITLNTLDLYDMVFEKISQSKKTFEITRKEVGNHTDIYDDMLQSCFTNTTGLHTSL